MSAGGCARPGSSSPRSNSRGLARPGPGARCGRCACRPRALPLRPSELRRPAYFPRGSPSLARSRDPPPAARGYLSPQTRRCTGPEPPPAATRTAPPIRARRPRVPRGAFTSARVYWSKNMPINPGFQVGFGKRRSKLADAMAGKEEKGASCDGVGCGPLEPNIRVYI